MSSKGHGLCFVIGGFRSILCVSVFQGLMLVIVIMIDISENKKTEAFEIQCSRVFEKRSKFQTFSCFWVTIKS